MEFNEILMLTGAFLLGASLTWIFGFWKGVTLAVAIDLLLLATKFEILDKITQKRGKGNK